LLEKTVVDFTYMEDIIVIWEAPF